MTRCSVLTTLRPKSGGRTRAAVTAAVAALLMTAPALSWSADGGGTAIICIDQDWELVVGTPDPDHCSPQIFALLYPASGGDFSCQFLINYCDQPDFSAGGVQIQIWQDTSVLDGEDNAPNQAVLQNVNETITFTLRMQLVKGNLQFSAVNVSSASWGDVNNLFTSVPYAQNSLASYSTADTLANSGILLGSNRVTSLRITQVRKTNSSGIVTTEGAQQIFPLPPPPDAPPTPPDAPPAGG
jgi:hypothetical protein